jgi:5-methyltetrahydrofolate corrinoid/iron sulfur protein methyltransferase
LSVCAVDNFEIKVKIRCSYLLWPSNRGVRRSCFNEPAVLICRMKSGDSSADVELNTEKGISLAINTKTLIMIGESLHASIARCGEAMLKAYENNDGQSLNYLRQLVASQAEAGADFIEVNVDKFGEKGFAAASEMMQKYVRMVAQNCGGAGVCIDSSDDELLAAGLKSLYEAGVEKKPLINSIKTYNADKMFAFAAEMPFSFIALLMVQGNGDPVAELISQANTIFNKAREAGFAPDDIYFDTGSFPLAIDMPMTPGEKGRTYTAFETIKQLKALPEFDGVHFSLGVSNCAMDMPGRRLGVIRAYVAKAIEYGMDAAIIDVRKDWFDPAPDPELVELMDAFVHIDGSPENAMRAMELMGEFCNQCREAKEAK